ncbi:hypothetical protein AALB64_04610 [Lachnospiraceae bacterium 45-P1]
MIICDYRIHFVIPTLEEYDFMFFRGFLCPEAEELLHPEGVYGQFSCSPLLE